MKRHTSATAVVDAPADRIWSTVAAGGDVHRWFGAVIAACELRGSGAGAERFCTMADGARLEERIVEVDPEARRFRYAIDRHPLPAADLTATIEVAGLAEGRSRVTWSAHYRAEAPDAEAVDRMLSGLYAQGIAALADHCRAAA